MQNPKNEAPTNQSIEAPIAEAEGNDTQSQTAQQSTADDKRFTQADVDRIVGERLSREREKLEAEHKREIMKQNARAAWIKAGYEPETFDGLELDEECRIKIDKAVNLFKNMSLSNEAKKTEKKESEPYYPHFTKPLNSAPPSSDGLFEAFKAPHQQNRRT